MRCDCAAVMFDRLERNPRTDLRDGQTLEAFMRPQHLLAAAPEALEFGTGLKGCPAAGEMQEALERGVTLREQAAQELAGAAANAVWSMGAIEASPKEVRLHTRLSQAALTSVADDTSRRILRSLAAHALRSRCGGSGMVSRRAAADR